MPTSEQDLLNTMPEQNSTSKRSLRNRLILAGIGILLLVGIVLGIALGVTHSRSNNDPSRTFLTWDGKTVDLKIKKDNKYKNSLYGLNYGPVNATWPSCGNTLGDVIEDIKVLSQLTRRIRLYGMDCNMVNYTLLAVEYLNLDVSVIPTIWVDNNETTYKRQHDDLIANLNQHGFKHIEGISVGNEVLFREEISKDELFRRIGDVRKEVHALPGGGNVPVFTSDLGSKVGQEFVATSDVVFANVHPYFAGISAEAGTNWTITFFEQNDSYFADKQKKPSVIAEVGWPTEGLSNKKAVASIENLNTFLNRFICFANEKKYKYFWFEAYDTPWKTQRFTILEGSWGLFYPDLTLKPGVNIPDCPPTAPNIDTL
ncbi:hypothetical protein G9A89_007175 [Geosiphon pyriformis]|nr:hypothetical protein G9A89_007175 [Geosiphon pyriformis]